MPIYEYICGECGRRFDFFAKRWSENPETCPECGATTLKKQFSVFNAKVGSEAGSTTPPCPTEGCCPTGTCQLK